MNPTLVNNVLRVIGTALVFLGHSGLVPQPWSQIVGEIGAGVLLLTKGKPGDIPLAEVAKTHIPIDSIPPEILESIRPSGLPPK